MSLLKLIISDQSKKTAESPIWFGSVWTKIHDALAAMGAYTISDNKKKVALSESLKVAYSNEDLNGYFDFSIEWINTTGFEILEHRKLNVQQTVNSGYSFLDAGESYVFLALDIGGVSNDALLNIGRELINSGYLAHFSSPSIENGVYKKLDLEYINNHLEQKHNKTA